MLILRRYYLKEFLKLFSLVGMGLASVLSLIDLIDRLDSFMPHDPPLGSLLYFALLNIPKNLLFVMPVGVLISGLYTMSQAVRSRELVAVMAAGGRVKKLLIPLLAFGVLLSVAGFALAEFISPISLKRAADLKRDIMRQAAAHSLFQGGTLWFRAKDGSIVNIKLYIHDKNCFRGVSVFRIEGDRLKEIVSSEEAVYEPGADIWVLKTVKRYDAENGDVFDQEELRYPNLGSPEVFREEARKPVEMGIAELARYTERLKEAGFRNQRLEVELNSKVSYPLINLFMMVLGLSLAARGSVGGLVAAGMGILISLLYYFSYTMSLSLGFSGILPPLLAVWTVPLTFSAAAAYFFARIPE